MTIWTDLCALADLPPNVGLAARLGDTQIALFHLPDSDEKVFALSNHDPKSGANVLARGILGDLGGERVVASPLYKQHYRLRDGHCMEDEGIKVPVWAVRIEAGRVRV
ncbi:MAG: nitrite reductase small subunit NirD, partial [Halothiobacillaceae bacterium]